MCEFCQKYDFSKATTEIYGENAYIRLAICNTVFPKEKQFNYCSVCGRDLKKESENNV